MRRAHSRPVNIVRSYESDRQAGISAQRFAVDFRQHVRAARPAKIGNGQRRALRRRTLNPKRLQGSGINLAGRGKDEPLQLSIALAPLEHSYKDRDVVTKHAIRLSRDIADSDN